jgi:hypothetical protein
LHRRTLPNFERSEDPCRRLASSSAHRSSLSQSAAFRPSRPDLTARKITRPISAATPMPERITIPISADKIRAPRSSRHTRMRSRTVTACFPPSASTSGRWAHPHPGAVSASEGSALARSPPASISARSAHPHPGAVSTSEGWSLPCRIPAASISARWAHPHPGAASAFLTSEAALARSPAASTSGRWAHPHLGAASTSDGSTLARTSAASISARSAHPHPGAASTSDGSTLARTSLQNVSHVFW